jgi:hypothetical protein
VYDENEKIPSNPKIEALIWPASKSFSGDDDDEIEDEKSIEE